MAKGQKKSNKEIRKPKQEKSAAAKTESTFGSQMKTASSANATGNKSKS
ncbi:hypothetical protein [Rhizobium sp. EC-SD404]|nr:hypothetical protein [Rhizobium sp. EC-SD404]